MQLLKIAIPVFLVVCFPHYALAVDISGVKIEDSLSSAKINITKANSKFSLSPLKFSDGKEAGVVAVTADRLPSTSLADSGGPSDEFVALQNDAEKIWFVARVQRFTQGSRIKKETLVDSLKEKFGPPSSEEQLFTFNMKWEFDRNGKQYIGHPSKGPCFSIGYSGTDIPGTSVISPRSFSPSCGTLITVSAVTQQDGMVSTFKLGILDAKSMYDQLNEKGSQAEAEKKRKLQQEQSKNMQPKI
ncbi:MAG: hypothetical protein EPO06_00060 [Burkholderiaceae bacterium]|nr:MAG: hypothetical protein EPO06_00060 [Burkholderiaceae bacterium]